MCVCEENNPFRALSHGTHKNRYGECLVLAGDWEGRLPTTSSATKNVDKINAARKINLERFIIKTSSASSPYVRLPRVILRGALVERVAIQKCILVMTVMYL